MSTRTQIGVVPEELVAPVACDTQQRQIAAMALSLTLRYPEEEFFSTLETIEEQLGLLPGPIAAEIAEFIGRARSLGLLPLQEHYVETFDQRRRCALHLSYYSVGDTRQRGAAILAFRQQLEGLGMEEISEELPDHLCVVLEALAFADSDSQQHALEMIAAHRDGLEVLRHALVGLGSPYAHLLTAVCMLLPSIDEETIDRYINLIRQGPPAEMVGIETTPLPFPTASPNHS
ncbi:MULTISPECIES: nitrate reductase molybdenum cofactor assembly chaperone [Corynebacterium]|uniref:nitrate reductase molybdenum cofactor assembly chaperone n=1 Tax=Corynebacterium TaxID=1716 RepID=UPI00210B858D|nr:MULTISPECIES: nitrate reductase molybdenum cofactor assembly chaperone [Corynebacterium]MCQ4607039.1 nitrate reductase molybdenum cofactor assembly chaperone [Corynebacterium pseudogenitalium]MDK8363565.1 nitrate reductase molybdenum cofactor assembly chaperone [Corynebacterium sp. UMB10119B]